MEKDRSNAFIQINVSGILLLNETFIFETKNPPFNDRG